MWMDKRNGKFVIEILQDHDKFFRCRFLNQAHRRTTFLVPRQLFFETYTFIGHPRG
jgi:hypothetical protein